MIDKLRPSKIIRRCVILIMVFFVFGCKSKVVSPEKTAESYHFKRVAIVPFQNMTEKYGEKVTIRGGISGRFYTTDKVAEGADYLLTGRMTTYIQGRKNLELIPVSQTEGAFSGVLSKEGGKELSELEMIVRVGQELGAEAVVVGKIYRFIDRDGTDYSVRSSASVAFDVFLIRVEDGRVIWSGRFDESQRSLTENLFDIGTFMKRRGRWVTAEEMAIDGLNDLLETFPAQ
ncbi:MAG TPA: hypothetical protein HPQ03_13525 [Deltaproteobacteria bacterium]|nr:hypothetical protein [Deltaproteobacteria bacterium]